MLLNFSDFTPQAKEAISGLLRSRSLSVDMIKLVAVADIQQEFDWLGQLLDSQSPKFVDRPSIIWAAQLARARLGSERDIEEVIQKIKHSSDAHMRGTSLVYNLAFVRQAAAIGAILDLLDGDERTVKIHGTPGIPLTQLVRAEKMRYT